MATKKKPRPRPDVVTLPRVDVEQALRALDASEQLLELLKDPLNAGEETFVNDLLSVFQDHAIVSARMGLAAALGKR